MWGVEVADLRQKQVPWGKAGMEGGFTGQVSKHFRREQREDLFSANTQGLHLWGTLCLVRSWAVASAGLAVLPGGIWSLPDFSVNCGFGYCQFTAAAPARRLSEGPQGARGLVERKVVKAWRRFELRG